MRADLISPTGGPAHGSFSSMLTRWLHQMGFHVEGLAPNTTYEATADGVTIGTFTTDANGASELLLSPDALNVDPREHHFAVREPGGADVLVMSDPDATTGGTLVGEFSPLTSFGGVGTATAGFGAFADGVQRFAVELKDVPPGSYVLQVDGMPRTTIDASSGNGVAKFSSDPGPDELLLDFDPHTAELELLLDDVTQFAGSGHAEIVGIDYCIAGTRSQPLQTATSGSGSASLHTRANCQRDFAVQIMGVPQGDYDLVVGGEWRATISVGADETGATEGDVTFLSNPGEGQLALDFDPRGQLIQVLQGDTLYFLIGSFLP